MEPCPVDNTARTVRLQEPVMAMQLFVVPRSMPIVLLMVRFPR